MDGVLILAHGSRAKETEKTFEAIVKMVETKVSQPVKIAYMEFSPANIKRGLESLREQGSRDIKVVPYFLFSGIHIQEDIPKELNAFSAEHPEVRITMTDTLGADPRIADIVVDRILEE